MILTNARIVTPDDVFLGTIKVEKGIISDMQKGVTSVRKVSDLEGDLLLPGLIELHTDNLEKHFTPRPKVRWPSLPAVVAHDAQIAAAGITTVFDAIALGDVMDGSQRVEYVNDMVEAVALAQAEGVTRVEHFLHLRCELVYAEVVNILDRFVGHSLLRLVSVMDHSPGQRQFTDVEKYRTYYQGKFGMSDQEIELFMQEQQAASQQFSDKNRDIIIKKCRELGVATASHDDATREHIQASSHYGMSIAEFPTTHEAAREAKNVGLSVLVGAPNLVRGISHSGNVSAHKLAEEGLLDIISSDYFPSSLLQAAISLHRDTDAYTLPDAFKTITLNPATAIRLKDRGEIAVSKRADLLRVREYHHLPLVIEVWREGIRIY